MSRPDSIERIWAREVLNFRGVPTVEAEVHLADGSIGRAAVATGISAGIHEVVQLRDKDAGRYAGMGVLNAVGNVLKQIAPALKGMPASGQQAIDKKLNELDGTPDKGRIGSNAILAVSLAVGKAAAASQKLPLFRYLGGEGPFKLPVPLYDILMGGAHAKGAVDFQEFLLVPTGFATFGEALHAGGAVYRTLGKVFEKRGMRIPNFGGPIPASVKSNREAMDLLMQAIEDAGYKPGVDCFVALDAATSELYRDGRYVLAREDRVLDTGEMIDLWERWLDDYPFISLEDGAAEDDWEGWKELTARLGGRLQLVGDDHFTTNPARIRRGIEEKGANAVLIKPNQIGTLSETLDAMVTAHSAGWACQLSSRSGEAEDTTIADLSVLPISGQIKDGPPNAEPVLKYNRLLRIEEDFGSDAEYAGLGAFDR